MKIDEKIRDEKLQLNINRKAAKLSAISLGKIDADELLVGAEVLPSGQRQMIQ